MHLKRIIKRIAVLGLTFSLIMSNMTMVSGAEIPTETENKVEASQDEAENDLQDTQGADGESKEEEKEPGDVVPDETNPGDQEAGTETDKETDTDTEEGSGSDETEKPDEPQEEEKFALTKAEFTDETETIYEMEVSNCELKKGESLESAVWSDTNGQDDLKWMELEKKTEDTYSLSIKISDFKSPGEYIVHIYCKKEDGSKEYVTGKRFQVTELSSGTVEIQEQAYEQGTAGIKISGLQAPSGVKKVRVAVWSQKDQKDLHWYTAEEKEDGWYADMDIAKYHKNNWNIYSVHVYAADGNGFEKYVGGTKVDFSMKTIPFEVVFDEKSQNASIELDGEEVKTPGKVEKIRCAVWSEDKGQDDLKWYQLDYSVLTKKWSLKFPLTMFKSTGKCFAHLYVVKSDGAQAFLGGKTFKLSNPSLGSFTVEQDNARGTFSITLNDLKTPLSYKKIEVAVWSQGNQSDLKWYETKMTEDGTFKVDSDISKHNYNIGTYNIHTYVTDGLGIRSCVGCTTMEFKKDIGKLAATDDKKETQYVVTLPVNEYPAGLKEVRFAAWSTGNGQDDLKWYTAVKDGKNYQATVDIRNHKTGGAYIIHAYGINKAGNQVYLAGDGSLINVKGTATGKIAVTGKNAQKGTFKVAVSGLDAPSGIDSVKVAAWNQKDQSDLNWYSCKKQSDGTWTAEVNVAKHKYNAGYYNLHVYATMGNLISSYAAGTSYDMQPKNLVFVMNDQGRGKRTVGICNPSNTGDLKFAVWGEAEGQDDLVWYKAVKGSNGKWIATMDGINHYDGGTFNLHAYAGSSCLGTMTFNFPPKELRNGWYYDKFNGKTYKVYYINNRLQKDVSGIIGHRSSYKAEVNRKTCTVNIFAQDGKNGYIIPVKTFACSVGMPNTPTPTGTFHTMNKYRWRELMGPSYGQYCTRIVDGILFHSVAGSNQTSYNLSAAEYNKLGSPASHGCVRLNVRDAKWIYDNCALGMEVRIYDSSYPGPFGKPATIKIPASQNWDPTDPNV